MKKNLLSIIIIFISTSCFSQNDWISGYIIKTQGDTVYGFVDNRASRVNEKYCFFRSELAGETQKFNPDELVSYRLSNGRYYVAKSIEEEGYENPVFLEFLIQGMLNIYHYSEEGISRFFAEKDGKLFELKNTKVIQTISQTVYQKENKEYIGLLSYALMDANMLQDIQKTKFNTKSLINVAKKYHEKVCTGEKCIIYERSSKLIHHIFSIHTGISLNKFNWGDYTVSDYRPSSLLGCSFEFENAFAWAENLNLILGLTYQNYTNYTLSEKDVDDGSNVTYNNQKYYLTSNKYIYSGIKNLDVNLKMDVLKIPVYINYNFSKGQIKPYIGAGISSMYVFSQNKDFVYNRFYSEYNKSIPTFHVGAIGTAGCKFIFKNNQGIYLELTYEHTQVPKVDQFLRFATNTFTLNCGYFF